MRKFCILRAINSRLRLFYYCFKMCIVLRTSTRCHCRFVEYYQASSIKFLGWRIIRYSLSLGQYTGCYTKWCELNVNQQLYSHSFFDGKLYGRNHCRQIKIGCRAEHRRKIICIHTKTTYQITNHLIVVACIWIHIVIVSFGLFQKLKKKKT